jgi:hypothetical protein
VSRKKTVLQKEEEEGRQTHLVGELAKPVVNLWNAIGPDCTERSQESCQVLSFKFDFFTFNIKKWCHGMPVLLSFF